jgi:hypothetical protein
MSTFQTLKDAIPIQFVIYAILAIPIGLHIYATYTAQKRKAEKMMRVLLLASIE